ncbi:hypothetical protein D3C71_1960900 [compost metagenome]
MLQCKSADLLELQLLDGHTFRQGGDAAVAGSAVQLGYLGAFGQRPQNGMLPAALAND